MLVRVSNTNKMNKIEKLLTTRKDAEDMLDTAMCNPDVPNFTCPPDGVRGLSTITRQKIVHNVSWQDNTTLPAYDLWIVQWDHEPTVPGNCSARYYCSTQPEDVSSYIPGQLTYPEAFSGYAGGGYATSLLTGGICIYYMRPGQSPFPASDGSGPFAPIFVKQLLYSDDVLHDNVRVLGSNHELVDTTNTLNQQGSCYQGSWDADQETIDSFSILGTNDDGVTIHIQNFDARPGLCPPGTTEDLVKLNVNRVGAAKEGYFTMNRLDMCSNKPSSQNGVNECYQSIANHPGLTGQRLYLVLQNQVGIVQTTGTGAIAYVNNSTQACRVYKTATQMNCTVLQSLSTSYAASVTREITTQCFIRPGSSYSAFAKPSYEPVDYTMLAALQNVMDNVQMFAASKANKNGSFARAAKGLWNKVAPVIKPIAGIAGTALKSFAPPAVAQAMDAAGKVVDYANRNPEFAGKDALKMFPDKTELLNWARSPAGQAAISAGAGKVAGAVKKRAAKKKNKTKRGEFSGPI